MAKRRVQATLYFAVMASAAAVAAALAAAQPRTVWDGVYSSSQAERGAKTYKSQCEMCHGAEMKGGPDVPSLVGVEFKFNWNGKPAGELFDYIKTMMPPGQAGTLSDQECADLLATIFKSNGFPSADGVELPTTRDALQTTTIVGDRP